MGGVAVREEMARRAMNSKEMCIRSKGVVRSSVWVGSGWGETRIREVCCYVVCTSSTMAGHSGRIYEYISASDCCDRP